MKRRNRTGRAVIAALLVVCMAVFAAACGSSEKKADTEPSQKDGIILYAGDGNFVISGYSADYTSTDVHMILDDEDLGSVGGGQTAGKSYVMVGTNVQDAVTEETEGYQKLVIQVYGSSDLAKDEHSEDCIEKTFYVKCGEGAEFEVISIIGTDEVTSPPDWKWE
ncbi:MAG: hypothetical protein IKD85_03360 [Firmicutes bacterium]|nr:hypothetical protein [Bacillota bacterium]